MDTITHGLITRLFAKAVLPKAHQRPLVLVTIACSVVPDADFLLGVGDPLSALRNHRGITHSFAGAVVLAFPLAAFAFWIAPRLVRRGSRRSLSVPAAGQESPHPAHGFWAYYVASALGISSHIVFDLVTSYGTMIFSPFSDRRVSLDLWFIIDPYVWLILLLPWVVRRIARGSETERGHRRADRVGAALLVGYLLLAVLVHISALRRVDAWARAQGLVPIAIGAIPVAFSPLHQKGIIITSDRVYDIPVYVARGELGPIAAYPSPFRDDPYIERAWATPEGRLYRWFARFPVAERVERGQEHRVVLADLRFRIRWEDLGHIGRIVARGVLALRPDLLERRTHTLEVVFDARGRIERIAFVP